MTFAFCPSHGSALSPTKSFSPNARYKPVLRCPLRRPRVAVFASTLPPSDTHSDTDTVTILEQTPRGPRLYVADTRLKSCDVFEDLSLWPGAGREPVAEASANGPGLPGGVLGRLFQAVMLPTGYPATVSPEFIPYALCVVGRNAFRKASYVLGTSALLTALGGISSGAGLSVSVAVNWVLKDGLGFGAKLSVSTQISRVLDKDPKFWRLVGDSLMALSVFIELCSPIRPSLFLLFGSASALAREVADACSGPSYRVFLQSLATNENIGDVSSRSGIHVVIGTLVGLGMGAGATAVLSVGAFDGLGLDRGAIMFSMAAVFSACHLACTWQETRTIRLRTLNRKRLDLVLGKFVESGGEVVMSLKEAAAAEPVISGSESKRVVLGAQLLHFVECGSDVHRAVARRGDGCIVALGDKGKVGVMLEEGVDDENVLKAALTAVKIRAIVRGMAAREREGLKQIDDEDLRARDRAGKVVEEGYRWAELQFGCLVDGLREQGWSTRLLVDLGGSRFREARNCSIPEKLTEMRNGVRMNE